MPQIEVTFDIDANGILNVTAKDKATSKEQKVTITASSMLAKEDVDQMVRDAAEHAEEDRQRRHEAESRNEADALTFQAERLVKDLEGKISDTDKAEIETSSAAVREALAGDRCGGDRLDQAAAGGGPPAGRLAGLRRGARLRGARPMGPAATGPLPEGEAEGEGEGEEETIEGEYKEVCTTGMGPPLGATAGRSRPFRTSGSALILPGSGGHLGEFPVRCR